MCKTRSSLLRVCLDLYVRSALEPVRPQGMVVALGRAGQPFVDLASVRDKVSECGLEEQLGCYELDLCRRPSSASYIFKAEEAASLGSAKSIKGQRRRGLAPQRPVLCWMQQIKGLLGVCCSTKQERRAICCWLVRIRKS
ncbi:hypothetical protein L7F22_033000 [Adiantum nelumboides]|nr:hypothetical protein [Adiantum nelumboides]